MSTREYIVGFLIAFGWPVFIIGFVLLMDLFTGKSHDGFWGDR